MIYAVIDTNVLVSSRLSKNPSAATIKVISNMIEGLITPVYNPHILAHLFYIYSHSFHPSLAFFQKNLVTFDTIHHLASLGQTKPNR